MSAHDTSRPITVVLGTRPEIIKLAKIVELLGDDVYIVHTGQHFDVNLSESFFAEFGMRPPDTFIGVGGQTRGEQLGNGTAALDKLFATLHPSAVVVQGDTNAVLAGALAANANNVPIAHVEAGLRSFDRAMPEEHNRVVADHLADLCLAPTDLNVANLAAEGINGPRVLLTGNPIIEAVERLMPEPAEQHDIAKGFGLDPESFVLATFHRPENVDDPGRLENILTALGGLELPVLLPLHPRTQQRIAEFGLESFAATVQIVDPIGYRTFIGLGARARLVVSDSGGVQEEVSVYKKPAVVVRRSTERQEVEGTFVERHEPDETLADSLSSALDGAEQKAKELEDVPSPYGDETAPAQIVSAIRDLVRSRS
ncbi:MAG: non-hydrolyzing UDP-N-acetylglucosamine 2-epimerase [Acidimicrobiia bacterium]